MSKSRTDMAAKDLRMLGVLIIVFLRGQAAAEHPQDKNSSFPFP
ncbi:MAG: hypothetical protein AB1512_19650 [Thermodesulfobacteriota bacterium]